MTRPAVLPLLARRLFPFAAALAAVAVWAPSAAATDYCVAPNTTCGGTNVALFEGALIAAAASSGADRIFLGAATYTAPSGAGYVKNAPGGSSLEIIGAGRPQTTVTAPVGASRVMDLRGTTVSDLTVALPESAAPDAAALELEGAARRVSITAAANQGTSPLSGVRLRAGSFVDGTVVLPDLSPSLPNRVGISIFGTAAGALVARSTVTAGTAVASGTDSTLERLLLTAGSSGVEAAGSITDSTVELRASVLRVVGDGVGILASAKGAGPATVNADGVTIVGDGSSPGSVGAFVSNKGPATLNLTSSIIRGTAQSLARAADGNADGNLTASFSDFDPAAVTLDTGPGTLMPPKGALNPGTNIAGAPLFANAAAGDFHLLDGSPAVDAGAPATPAGLDFDGNPWVTDGNGDGVARRDMGAFERPAKAVPPGGGPAQDLTAAIIRRFRAAPPRFALGARRRPGLARRTTFRYRLDETVTAKITIQRALPGRRVAGSCRKRSQANRGRPRCTRYVKKGAFAAPGDVGPNARRFSGRLRGRALRAGRYRAVIRARDGAGNRSTPRFARFRILAR